MPMPSIEEKAESFDKIEAIVKKCVLHKMSAKEAINAIFAEISLVGIMGDTQKDDPEDYRVFVVK